MLLHLALILITFGDGNLLLHKVALLHFITLGDKVLHLVAFITFEVVTWRTFLLEKIFDRSWDENSFKRLVP